MTLTNTDPRESTFMVYELIEKEIRRQDHAWGIQRHTSDYWLGILIEELGAAAKAVVDRKSKEAYDELVQVAAVAVQWLRSWNVQANKWDEWNKNVSFQDSANDTIVNVPKDVADALFEAREDAIADTAQINAKREIPNAGKEQMQIQHEANQRRLLPEEEVMDQQYRSE